MKISKNVLKKSNKNVIILTNDINGYKEENFYDKKYN
jgi:hypothetical protein